MIARNAGGFAGVVRVEQVERHPADRGAPGADRAGRALQVDRDLERSAVRARDGLDRRGVAVEGVGRVLLAAGREALAEVALAVEQPDPDEGDVEVRALLEVVAGEEAEPARVEGERVVEPELGREVRDRRARRRGPPRTSRAGRRGPGGTGASRGRTGRRTRGRQRPPRAPTRGGGGGAGPGPRRSPARARARVRRRATGPRGARTTRGWPRARRDPRCGGKAR